MGCIESRGQTSQPPTHQPSSFSSTGWEDPHPLDSPRSHSVPEIHLSQRCVELWYRHVGGDVLRGAALLGHDQSGRKSPRESLSGQPDWGVGGSRIPGLLPISQGAGARSLSSQVRAPPRAMLTNSNISRGLGVGKIYHLQVNKSLGCHLVANPE